MNHFKKEKSSGVKVRANPGRFLGYFSSETSAQTIYRQTYIDEGQKLGRGAFGQVFRGTYDDKVVAIKVSDHSTITIEIAIQQKLMHPNIVQFIASARINLSGYLVMELISGGNLENYARNSNLPLDEKKCLDIVSDVAEGLAYLHGLGILHRDIKSSNMLFTAEMRIKIADFGLAIELNNVVESGVKLVGTPIYMAPEILYKGSARAYRTKTDIYALGVMIFELIRRKEPFSYLVEYKDGKPNFSKLSKHIGQGKRASFPNDASISLQQLVEQCWNQDPEQRPEAVEIIHRVNEEMNSKQTESMVTSFLTTQSLFSSEKQQDNSNIAINDLQIELI